MRVDLHLHTWVSDGDVGPVELTRLAVGARLGVIAVTDHDTAAGVRDAQLAAADLPLVVIPGIEVSTRWEGRELHILGYWIDPTAESILVHQQGAARRRSRRMEEMIGRLKNMGLDISYEDVAAAAGPEVRSLGRPHLARALHERGHTRFYGKAFSRFIGDGGPAFVAEGFPLPEAAVNTIHAAGGVAVWAHPPIPWLSEGMALMREWGIDGIECFRPGLEPPDVNALVAATQLAGLFPTGGSDWHGPHRANLGDFSVDAYRVRDLLALGGVPF